MTAARLQLRMTASAHLRSPVMLKTRVALVASPWQDSCILLIATATDRDATRSGTRCFSSLVSNAYEYR